MSSDRDLQNAVLSFAAPYSTPVFFGKTTESGLTLSNGTGALVRLNHRFVGVTCYHVVEQFRSRRAAGDADFFYFGDVAIDPEKLIIAQSHRLDLVTFDLDHLAGKSPRLAPENFYVPHRWPPVDVELGNLIVLVGFPGEWTEQTGRLNVQFSGYSFGGIVDSVGEEHIYTRLLPGESIAILREKSGPGFVGGVSGAPVFLWRDSPIWAAELVGFEGVSRIARSSIYSPCDLRGRVWEVPVDRGRPTPAPNPNSALPLGAGMPHPERADHRDDHTQGYSGTPNARSNGRSISRVVLRVPDVDRDGCERIRKAPCRHDRQKVV